MSFWEGLLKVAVPAAATLYGAKMASDASDKAAKQATQATQAGTDVQLEGLKVAQQNLEVNRRAASPGLLRTQEIIARGSRLTPEQEQAVEDSRRQSINALKGSSLRGSARATSALVSDTDKRVRNNFMTQNQNAADSAARSLAGQYFGAGTNIANNATQTGNAVSQGLVNQGNIQASNTLGQGALRGQAIGDVGAIIADSVKNDFQDKRDSSYERVG